MCNNDNPSNSKEDSKYNRQCISDAKMTMSIEGPSAFDHGHGLVRARECCGGGGGRVLEGEVGSYVACRWRMEMEDANASEEEILIFESISGGIGGS